MHRLPTRLLLASFCLCPPLASQTIRFEAPINQAEDAHTPPVRRGVPGMRVIARELIPNLNALPGGLEPPGHVPGCGHIAVWYGFLQEFRGHHRCTDGFGSIAFRFTGLPTIGHIIGPSADDIEIETSADVSGQRLAARPPHSQFSISGPPTSIDITAGFGAGFPLSLSAAEANAFFHVEAAKRTLDPYGTAASTRRIHVRLHEYPNDSYAALWSWLRGRGGNPAFHRPSEDRIYLYAPYDGSSTEVRAAFSSTTIAHEYAHRIVNDVYGRNLLPRRLSEGLCDYMAFLVTGHTRISVGVIPSPRDIATSTVQLYRWTGYDHADGLVLASALYRARVAFGAVGRGAVFDAAFRAALHAAPRHEVAFLQALLAALTSSASDQNLVLAAFAVSGITPHATSLGRFIEALTGGWSASADGPRLEGEIDPVRGSGVLRASGFSPSAETLWFVSGAPTGMFATSFGDLFLDFGTLLAPGAVRTDARGSVEIAVPVYLRSAALALHVLAIDPSAPSGMQVTNGVLVVL